MGAAGNLFVFETSETKRTLIAKQVSLVAGVCHRIKKRSASSIAMAQLHVYIILQQYMYSETSAKRGAVFNLKGQVQVLKIVGIIAKAEAEGGRHVACNCCQ